MFRGQIPEGVDPRSLMQVEPLHPEYRDRDACLAVMDEQGLERVVLFPTLACGIEQALRDDIPATMATLRAFNRWLEEDWGFSYEDRIFARADAVARRSRRRARPSSTRCSSAARAMVHVRPAPVPTADGSGRSFGRPAHDPVWARLAEAGVPVAFHLGDSGYEIFAGAWGGKPTSSRSGAIDPLRSSSCPTGRSTTRSGQHHRPRRVRPSPDAARRQHRERLRLGARARQAAAEAGEPDAVGVPRGSARHDPPHVWVTPYFEEDMRKLADTIGVDKVLFGSDWPHGEGLANPLDFVKELHALLRRRGPPRHARQRPRPARAVRLIDSAAAGPDERTRIRWESSHGPTTCWSTPTWATWSSPDWMVRVKEDYFKAGHSMFESRELHELLDEMDAMGVERAVLITSITSPSQRVLSFVDARPDRFSIGIGGHDLLRPMENLRDLERFVADHPVAYAFVGTELLGRRHVPADRRGVLPALHEVLRARPAAVHEHRPARAAHPRRGPEPDPPRPRVRALPRAQAVHDARRRPVVGRRHPPDDQVREPSAHDLGVGTPAPARSRCCTSCARAARIA